VESDGEREMTQDEVSKLVHSALRRARKATANEGQRLASLISADSTPNSSVHGMYSRSPRRGSVLRPTSTRLVIRILKHSRSEMDHLRYPTMDSLIGSVPSNYSMMSANSSDDVLRKVEEEIQSSKAGSSSVVTKRANHSQSIH
jgi:hypothetical protein